MDILFYPIIIPSVAGALCLLLPKARGVKESIALTAAALNLVLCAFLFNKELLFSTPWGGFCFEFSLRLYHFSAFIMLAAAGFTFLITLYCTVFLSGKNFAKQFFSYMLYIFILYNYTLYLLFRTDQ